VDSTAGGADPVLLLHGQPGGARDWDRVIAAIAGRARTIAFDRPGWDGKSSPRDLDGNADAAIRALDAAGVAQATVVGHSFGGAVACTLAAEHPERVSALVLLAPSANVASLYAADRVLAAPGVGELGSALVVGLPALALRTRPTRRLIAAWLGLSATHLATAGRAFGRLSAWRAFTVEQRSLVRDLPALEERLGGIAAPTRILIGSRDVVVPPASARRLAAQIPQAELEVVRGAGHLLPLRHSGRVAAAIVGP
jgi:pimeloyl-ACP methyl ester carboxylesterase